MNGSTSAAAQLLAGAFVTVSPLRALLTGVEPGVSTDGIVLARLSLAVGRPGRRARRRGCRARGGPRRLAR